VSNSTVSETLAEESGIYTPGTYTAAAEGIGGEVKVTMTFSDDKITKMDLDVSTETEGIGREAGATLQEEILSSQSTFVDGVVGATVTSNAVKQAATQCIAQAKGEIAVESAAESSKSSDLIVGTWVAVRMDLDEYGYSISATSDVNPLEEFKVYAGDDYTISSVGAGGTIEGTWEYLEAETEKQNDGTFYYQLAFTGGSPYAVIADGQLLIQFNSNLSIFYKKSSDSSSVSTSSPSTSTKSSSSSSTAFTNKYGTATTKCAHSGCNNYIASSGDTNACEKHSNKCLNCGKYIDEDAMYCMDCLTKAASKSSSSSSKSSSQSSGSAGGTGKCQYKEGDTYVCSKTATNGNFCKEHYEYLNSIYNSLVGK
jgi:uncharacterized protein with FMN-binding domain